MVLPPLTDIFKDLLNFYREVLLLFFLFDADFIAFIASCKFILFLGWFFTYFCLFLLVAFNILLTGMAEYKYGKE